MRGVFGLVLVLVTAMAWVTPASAQSLSPSQPPADFPDAGPCSHEEYYDNYAVRHTHDRCAKSAFEFDCTSTAVSRVGFAHTTATCTYRIAKVVITCTDERSTADNTTTRQCDAGVPSRGIGVSCRWESWSQLGENRDTQDCDAGKLAGGCEDVGWAPWSDPALQETKSCYVRVGTALHCAARLYWTYGDPAGVTGVDPAATGCEP